MLRSVLVSASPRDDVLVALEARQVAVPADARRHGAEVEGHELRVRIRSADAPRNSDMPSPESGSRRAASRAFLAGITG